MKNAIATKEYTTISMKRQAAARAMDAWREKNARYFRSVNTTALIRSLREAHGRP